MVTNIQISEKQQNALKYMNNKIDYLSLSDKDKPEALNKLWNLVHFKNYSNNGNYNFNKIYENFTISENLLQDLCNKALLDVYSADIFILEICRIFKYIPKFTNQQKKDFFEKSCFAGGHMLYHLWNIMDYTPTKEEVLDKMTISEPCYIYNTCYISSAGIVLCKEYPHYMTNKKLKGLITKFIQYYTDLNSSGRLEFVDLLCNELKTFLNEELVIKLFNCFTKYDSQKYITKLKSSFPNIITETMTDPFQEFRNKKIIIEQI